jgi:MFS transporter, putative metabolite transport protein
VTPTLVLRNPGDVYSLINSGRLRPRRATMVAAVALGSIFLDGCDLGSFGIGTIQVSHAFHLSKQSDFGFQSLAFLSAVLMGASVGGLIGGYFTDKLGRRKMFLFDLILLFCVTVLSATAPTAGLFWFWRFMMGVAVGTDVPVALAFIAEFSAVSSKGRNVMLAQVMSTGASVVLFLVMIPIYATGVGDSLWRYAIGLGAIPAAIVLAMRFFYTSESPMWSATYQGLDHAAEIIKKTYYVDEVMVQPDQRQDQRQARRAVVRPGAILELFRAPYGIRTLLVSILVVTQAVEFYGISLYTPKILTAMLGNRVELVLLLSAVANTFGVIEAILCVMTVERLGLRRLAAIGYAVAFSCLAIISGAYPLLAIPVATILVWIFYAGHNFGPGYAGTAMGSLSYPTSIRGIGGSYTQAITRAGGIIGAYAFPVLLSAVGQRATIGYIALVPLVGLLFVLLIKWEPIGKDVEVAPQGTEADTAQSRPGAHDGKPRSEHYR